MAIVERAAKKVWDGQRLFSSNLTGERDVAKQHPTRAFLVWI